MVDEVLCAGIVLQCLLNSLSFTDCVAICIGGPEQFGVVCSIWVGRGATPWQLLNSEVFNALCGGAV